MNVPTVKSYEAFMKKEGLVPESVDLPHGAAAHWIGNSSAKNVVIYYHGLCIVWALSLYSTEYSVQISSLLIAANIRRRV